MIDFAVAGFLLFGTGLTYGLLVKNVGRVTNRAAVGKMLAAALANTLVAAITFFAGLHLVGQTAADKILMINGVLVVLWISSALLFRSAAERPAFTGTELVG